MIDISKDILSEFTQACHETTKYGLLRCSSGNMSMRLDKHRMIVSASRSWLGNLTQEQISVCNISDGAHVAGPPQTVEINFHAGIMRNRPDINIVLHFQTPAATTLACMQPDQINYNVIPEIPFYIGPIGQVPYLPPGSTQLAKAVSETMKGHNLAILKNHGQVSIAKDFAHAIQNAVFFELACDIILRAGEQLDPLNPDAVSELLDASQRPNGKV